MSQGRTKGADRIARQLTVRPSLSRAAVKFIEKYPDEVPRIVALALEAAAAREGTDDATLVRTLPEALRRLIVPARTDDKAARVLSISEAAELLEVTRVTIYAWIEAKRLLAWQVTRRGMLIPAEQIVGPGEVVPGIERVLGVISEPAAAWDFLTEESPYIDPHALRRPIDALRAGDLNAVVTAAHSFLDAFT
jgi:excisionase family DNA binding protein